MNPTSASHRSIAILALVVFATRGLSHSRGNLNDIGAACFALVLIGLVPVLLLGWRWQGSSDTAGGFPTWQVALPCAFAYVFAISAGEHLLVASPQDWRATLRLITGAAAVTGLAVLLLAIGRCRDRLAARWQTALLLLPLLLALSLFLLVPTVSPAPRIDVFVFQTEAARSLLSGTNPYDITFTNVYEGAGLYPSGAPDSYPYAPLSLVTACIGLMLGDVRWPLIACHIAAAVLLYATARQRRLPTTEAIALGGLFFYLPHAPFVAEQAWTDPSVALSLALMSLLLARRQPAKALWAGGVAVALKQTMVLLLPLLWGLWRRLGRAQLIAVSAVGIASYGVFLLWDAGALWNDVVTFHMGTPFRPRALTLSAYLVYFAGSSPLPAWLSFVGLALGISASLTALRPERKDVSPCDGDRVWRFYLGLAFAYLLTLALSKHAFMNYYYLVQFALVAALVWSRVADREATPA